MKPTYPIISRFFLLILVVLPIFLISCEEEEKKEVAVPEIKVVKVLQRDTPIYKEFVGQMYGLKDIPIRARVQGFLDSIYFNEGMPVKKGSLLYKIDPQPFMADVAAKQSNLAEAKTMLVNAENELARYIPLAEINAVSESDLDAAQASRDAAMAGVDAARANLKLSEINLSYTVISSPIRGVIGKTEAREGEFVGKDPNPVILNTVSRIDTMRVQFFLTEREYLMLVRENLGKNRMKAPKVVDSLSQDYNLDLILSDGSVYIEKGKVDFINRNVDPTTGSMLVQAHFPNPNKILRPGLYAKIRAQMTIKKDALLVPQRCVSEMQGQFSLYVVTDSNTVVVKRVTVGARIGDLWLIKEGIEPRDLVVIDGLQKVGDGLVVNPQLIDFKSKSNAQN